MLIWNIWQLMGAVILLLIILLMVLVILIGQGFSEKFGPEWIPHELGIEFNHLKITFQNSETIFYQLNESETEQVRSRILFLITVSPQKPTSLYPDLRLTSWKFTGDESYECRENETQKLKAVFSVRKMELRYYK
jgi:hypothetical protein